MKLSSRRSGASQWFGRLIHKIEQKPASDRLILRVLFFAIVGTIIWGIITINKAYTAPTPVAGGTLIEGIVGIPRFVNPVLAVTRADQDMSALLFRGMMKINNDGILVPDLAESVTVSDDGKTYNVIMRRDERFHDNVPLTARDVAFTIGLIQNPDLKSPLRGNWSGVTLEEISEYEINIVLDEPYTPFIENFTIGILPRHIWSELPIEQVPFSQRNTEPIGAGVFSLDKVVRNESGLISSYNLKRASSEVKLERVVVNFYQNESELSNAFQAGEINSTANLPLESLNEVDAAKYNIVEKPLPRIFTLFFNQNKSVALRDAAVREALEMVIDREGVVNEALLGYGIATNTPLPSTATSSEITYNKEDAIARATEKLLKSGWQKNQNNLWEKRIDGNATTLSFTIKTANMSLLTKTTGKVAEDWRALGVQIEIDEYEQSDLLQAVIRPRDFEILLFGLDMNRTVDLYPFWHSSQREDPGLNIAQYANIEADTLLAAARTTTNEAERDAKATTAMNIIMNERPALFLYVPTLTYVVDSDVTVSSMTGISKPHERFMNIDDWHVAKEDRWPFFR